MGTEIGNTITVAPGQSFTITLDTADPVASPNVTITKNEVVTDDITHSSTEDVHEKSFTFHTKSTADGSYVIKITNSNTDYITNVLVHLDESEMNAINPQLSEQEINDNRMKADAAKLAAGIEAAKSRTEADLNTYYDAWAYTTVNGKKILVTQKNGTLSILYQGKQLAAIALPDEAGQTPQKAGLTVQGMPDGTIEITTATTTIRLIDAATVSDTSALPENCVPVDFNTEKK